MVLVEYFDFLYYELWSIAKDIAININFFLEYLPPYCSGTTKRK